MLARAFLKRCGRGDPADSHRSIEAHTVVLGRSAHMQKGGLVGSHSTR